MEESIGTPENGNYGLLYFKYVAYDLLNIPADNLIQINGIVYNANEAGNFLWGMVLQDNDVLVNPAWAADKKSREGPEKRPYEQNEQKAIKLVSILRITCRLKRLKKKENDEGVG